LNFVSFDSDIKFEQEFLLGQAFAKRFFSFSSLPICSLEIAVAFDDNSRFFTR